jgi:hypothetical protein
MQMHLYGENLAAAVFALNASKDNVDTIIMSEKPITTQFSGIEFAYQRVDRGMVLVEPQRTKDLENDLSLYDGQFRSSSLTFLHHVTRWIRNLGITLEDVRVETLFRGQRYGDFFIADQFDALHGLTEQERRQILFEIDNNMKNKDFTHPKFKNDGDWYARNKYYQSSELTIGKTISENFFKPFLNKMHGGDFQKLIASEHRSSWVPFYYPESVSAWIKGSDTKVERKTFEYLKDASFSGFMYKIEKYLDDNFEKQPDNFEEVWSKGGTTKSKNKNVYFGSPKRLSAIETFKTTLSSGRSVYLRATAKSSYTLFIVDDKFFAFRLNQRPMDLGLGSCICIEFGASSSHLSSETLILESMKLCDYLEIVIDPDFCQVVDSRYPLRLEQSPSLFDDLKSNRDLLRDRNFIGYPISEINGSINDQVCAALAVHHQISTENKESIFEF